MRAAREAHARECWDRIGNVARGCRGATEQERKFIQADSLPKRRRRGSLILGASISTLTAPAATRRGSFGGAPGDRGALRGPRCNVAARDMRRNPPLRDSSTQFTGVCRPKADLPELPLLAGRGRIADLRMAAAILGSESQTGREPPKCEIRRRRGARSGSAPAPCALGHLSMPTPVTFSSRATSVFASVAVCGKCAALSTSSRVMSIVRRRMWRCEARTRIEAARCVGFEAFAMSRTRHGLPSFAPHLLRDAAPLGLLDHHAGRPRRVQKLPSACVLRSSNQLLLTWSRLLRSVDWRPKLRCRGCGASTRRSACRPSPSRRAGESWPRRRGAERGRVKRPA